MGKIVVKKGLKSDVKIVDPKPIWLGIITTESGKQIKRYMGIEEAEKYMKAGHPVKLVTTAGELRQYD